jgi:hypothetical protein
MHYHAFRTVTDTRAATNTLDEMSMAGSQASFMRLRIVVTERNTLISIGGGIWSCGKWRTDRRGDGKSQGFGQGRVPETSVAAIARERQGELEGVLFLGGRRAWVLRVIQVEILPGRDRGRGVTPGASLREEDATGPVLAHDAGG